MDNGQMRPRSIDSFVGQAETVSKMKVVLDSAKIRGKLPPHFLLTGPPGLGKTSLAKLISEETGLPLQTIVGASLEKPKDVIDALNGMKRSQVLFIDEIHGVSKQAEESLYSAMEDGEIHIAVGNGAQTEYVTLHVPDFILVGATTKIGSLSRPLIDRFDVKCVLRPYTESELAEIISGNAETMGVKITQDAINDIASRANGTPRVANSLLRQVRDSAVVQGISEITLHTVEESMSTFGIDSYGLDHSARNVLVTLADTFDGGPVGGSRLATASNEKVETLENAIEPALMKYGLMKMTSRGRVITDEGRKHVGR